MADAAGSERIAKTCINCSFGNFGLSESFVACKRYPAEIQKRTDDWCGEWKLALNGRSKTRT